MPGMLLAVIFWYVSGPIAQPQSYHQFADQRLVFDIPHVGDVLSNLAFIVTGAWGLGFLWQPRLNERAFIDRRERRAFWCLFTGVFLTGFGSGWYHLNPDNYSLVWDRLPMTLAFMGIFAIMISERIKLSLGLALLWPLQLAGIASVLWWIWTEYQGHGDLRLYLIVQFYPMIAMLLMLLLLPTPYTLARYYWALFFFYSGAKLLELIDHPVYEFSQGMISGHSLKHLLAAAGVACLVRMLWLRQPCSTG